MRLGSERANGRASQANGRAFPGRSPGALEGRRSAPARPCALACSPTPLAILTSHRPTTEPKHTLARPLLIRTCIILHICGNVHAGTSQDTEIVDNLTTCEHVYATETRVFIDASTYNTCYNLT